MNRFMWIRMEPVDFKGSAAQPVRAAVRTGVFWSFRAPNRFEPRFEPANPVPHYEVNIGPMNLLETRHIKNRTNTHKMVMPPKWMRPTVMMRPSKIPVRLFVTS